jgi:hypothetical protein
MKYKATLTLGLAGEPENDINGWFVANGNYTIEGGVGVLFIVSPDMARRMKAGNLSVEEHALIAAGIKQCLGRLNQRDVNWRFN